MTIQAPQSPAQPKTLLDPAFMARLDQLDVMSRKMLAGKMKGERRSKQRGQSVEFADYRNYVIGDDLRFIDWNIYARSIGFFSRCSSKKKTFRSSSSRMSAKAATTEIPTRRTTSSRWRPRSDMSG